MSKPGRRSYRAYDLPLLVAMAERWQIGKSGISVRKLSQHIVEPTREKRHEKLDRASATLTNENSNSIPTAVSPTGYRIAGVGTKESIAKRLERAFNEYIRRGIAEPVSVYRCRDAERYSVLNRTGERAFGPFSEHRLTDPIFVEADRKAIENVARNFELTAAEVEQLSAKGLKILKKCLPHDYPYTRI